MNQKCKKKKKKTEFDISESANIQETKTGQPTRICVF